MTVIDLVVTIGAEEKQGANFICGHEMMDETKGRRIAPMQIVEEKNERVFAFGKDVDEVLKSNGEAGSGSPLH